MSTIKSSAENLTLNADGAGNDIIIQSNASTKLTVDGATGNLGIGTTTPSQKLDITGNIAVSGTVDGIDIATRDAILTSTTTTAGAALPKAGGTMTGNLTVSRSSGNAVTRLQGASNSQSSKLFISHTSSGSGGLFYSGNVFDIFSYGDIRINSGTGNVNDTIANERMVIKNNGKVGIGETAPLGYLHVKNGDSGQGSVNAAGDSLVLESNGSTGITFLSGSSSNTSLIMGDSESNYQGVIIYDHSVNAFKFATTGSERMRIDSSGKVGIGTAAPTGLLHVDGHTSSLPTILEANGNGDAIVLQFLTKANNGSTSTQGIYSNAGSASTDNTIVLGNSGTSGVMVNSTGYVGIGVAPSGSVRCQIEGASVAGHSALQVNNHSYYSPYALVVYNADGVNRSGHEVNFNRAGSTVGGISTSTSATSFNTSSDYRIKENVDYTWDATTRLKQLKPARFNFISDDTNTLVDGFIAHEVSGVVPEAISGTKDAMTAETFYTEDDVETQGESPAKLVGDVKTYSASEINPQSIDQSKLVPLLVKTIQELEARITALEA